MCCALLPKDSKSYKNTQVLNETFFASFFIMENQLELNLLSIKIQCFLSTLKSTRHKGEHGENAYSVK